MIEDLAGRAITAEHVIHAWSLPLGMFFRKVSSGGIVGRPGRSESGGGAAVAGTEGARRRLGGGWTSVYVSSRIGELTRPGGAAHATAKAALDAFARYVAAEAGPGGIAVNVVAPGAVRTDASATTL